MTNHIENHHSHRTALEAVKTAYAYQFSTADTSSAAIKYSRSPSKQEVPLSSTLSVKLQGLLRHLGVSLDDVDSPDQIYKLRRSIEKKRVATLESIKIQNATLTSSLETYLGSADGAFQLLSESLHADSNFGKVSLTDQELERDLTYLEEQVALVTHAIGGLDLEVLHRRDKAQEKFMDRWSHRP